MYELVKLVLLTGAGFDDMALRPGVSVQGDGFL
jgi:hypothetical protein